MALRILTVSKPYVCRPYRRKLEILATEYGHTMGLVCPDSWGSQKFEPEPEDSQSKLWIKPLHTYFPNKNHFHLYKGLSEAIDEFRPDILNVEEEDYSLVTWQAYRLARRRKIRPMFYAWQNIYKNYPPPFSTVEKYVYRHSWSAMGGSQNAGNILRTKGYKGRYDVVPQIGIDVDLFQLGEYVDQDKRNLKTLLGLDPDRFVVFFGGRIVEEKGVQTLIQAASLLNNPKLQLLVVGSGPYLDVLKEQASKLLKRDAIVFVSHVTSSRMPLYIKASDALCLASLTRPNWMEQGPVRIMTESMAAQTVAIVSDSGELPDCIGDCGLVFHEGQERELANRIDRLLGDLELVKTLRAKALHRVRSEYSASAIAKKCSVVFERS